MKTVVHPSNGIAAPFDSVIVVTLLCACTISITL